MGALAVALSPATVLADADPASDVLLGTNVFYPYNPPVQGSLATTLNAETAAAARAHFPIKIALIDSPIDLGAIPSFFDKPQPYAKFLDQELGFVAPHLPLLVVMPDGYGMQWLPAVSLPKLAGSGSNDMVRAAIAAVLKLAAAAGHPLKGVPDAPGGGGGGSPILTLVALVLVAVAGAGAVTAVRRGWRPFSR